MPAGFNAFHRFFICVSLACLLLTGCGSPASESAYCVRLKSARSSLAHLAATTEQLSTVSAGDARDAFEAGIAELDSLSELSPTSLTDELDTIRNAYRTIAMELIEINWDTATYVSSSAAEAQLELVTGNSVNQAIARIGVDSSERCKFDIDFMAETADTLVTLPQPPVPDISQPDLTIEPVEGDSATIALGLVIADRYELAVTDSEALCLGTAFNAAPETGLLGETEIDVFYRQIFKFCGIEIN